MADGASTGVLKRQRISLDDLTPYEGSWVALREGRVVDGDADPAALRQRVRQSDKLLLVPRSDVDALIL
ncbi:MAG: hypothetical protein ACRDV0_00600 [Acidimicrobiales bacterium]